MNGAEQETAEETPIETELRTGLAEITAQLNSILPDPAVSSISSWYPATLEQDPHINSVSVTQAQENDQPPLTYAAAAKTALEPTEGHQSHASQMTPACRSMKADMTAIREKLKLSQNGTIWQRRSEDQSDGYHSYEIPTQADEEDCPLTNSEDSDDEEPPGLQPPGLTNHSEVESSDDEEEVQQYATAAAVFNYNSLKARTQRILNRGRNGTLKHHV